MPDDLSMPRRRFYAELLGLSVVATRGALDALSREIDSACQGDAEALERRLAAAGLPDPAAGARAALALAESPLARDRAIPILALLLENIAASADADMALRNFERFARAALDRAALYGLLLEHPVLVRFLAELFAFSEFLADILIRNPEYLDWLLSPERIDADAARAGFEASARQAVAPFRKPESARRALARWKRREVLRIGARDMLGKADIRQSARELSWLAEAAIGVALDYARAQCEARYGRPASESPAPGATEPNAPTAFCVYGMGKLGGEDLNFSSDIDLIFLYDEEGRTTGVRDSAGELVHRITNHEFFTKLGERLVAFLSDPNEEGMLFRVDMRLRPEGKTGPLARSLTAHANYLVEQGQPWERVAYLKARRVAGDEALAARFDECVRHFVFADPRPEALACEMVRLKDRIDSELLDAEGRRRDLKRGRGGIREIEFVASYLAIVRGAHDAALRTRDTVEALRLLAERGALAPDDAAFLVEAYFFFRRLEHRLQMMAERQTCRVPDDPADWGRLARRDGDREGTTEAAGRRLAARYTETVERVHALFRRTFGVGEESPTEEALDPAALILHHDSEAVTPKALALLERAGFREAGATRRAMRELAFGTTETTVSARGRERFERILPALLELAPRLPWPDAAVRSLDAFLRAAKGRTLLYELLAEQPAILRLLLYAFGSGPVLARSLIAHPEWLDEILETGALAPDYEVAAQTESVRRSLDRARDDDEAWKRLRQWKEKTALILGLLEVLGIADEEAVARQTTALAEVCLRSVAARVEKRLLDRLGAPRAGLDGEGGPLAWTLIGFGGFGGRSVSHFSDLDIALIYSERGRVPGAEGLKASHWYSRLGEDLIGVMTAVSPEGQLFKVDARLRPEGLNAPLAATLEHYIQYYENEAQTWEWQAVLKARCVAGDDALAARFFEALWNAMPPRLGDAPALAAEVRSMRRRLAESVKLPRWAETDIKRGRGGIADIDFILQFLQLKTMAATEAAKRRARLATPETPAAIAALREANALTAEDADLLRDEHLFLRTLQRRLRLLFETARDYFPAKADRLDPLRRALATRLPDGEDLAERLRATRERLVEVFDRLVS